MERNARKKGADKSLASKIGHMNNTSRLNFNFKDIGNAIEQLVNMSYRHKFTQKVKYQKVTHEQVKDILKRTVSFE